MMPVTGHDSAHPVSAANCDLLFETLTPRVPHLRRHKAHGCCAFFQDGNNRFAYVYHRKRRSRLEVWFVGDHGQDLRYANLLVRARNPTRSGYGKQFKDRFYLEEPEQMQTAGDLLWRSASSLNAMILRDDGAVLPEEIDPELYEGAIKKITVNAYERNEKARRRCIEVYGTSCWVCKMSFGQEYGPEAEGFIHVHHIRPLSEVGEEYIIDPVEDLRPVCPNCHAVLHMGGHCRELDEVRQLLRQRRDA